MKRKKNIRKIFRYNRKKKRKKFFLQLAFSRRERLYWRRRISETEDIAHVYLCIDLRIYRSVNPAGDADKM